MTAQPGSRYDYIDLDYELSIGAPEAIDLLPPIKWGGAEIRCDDRVSHGSSVGCVVPWFTPTLRVSRAMYGSSADMIEWAQHNLTGSWGLRGSGQPLHRLQNRQQQMSNRAAMCGASKFTRDPAVQDDSCDEFPFAGTYESAALNGVDHGQDCAQVTAVRASSSGDLAVDWPVVAPLGSFTGAEKCVRGHIPRDLNTNLGGIYGVFVGQVLLADGDPFWVSVTF
ncbi:hypothetical protein [Streptomyces bohaiensis]|nr:hypothetical protein [Streptomyces bohaiensis]